MLRAGDVENVFGGTKKELIFGPHQYPFHRRIDYAQVKDRFGMNIPWKDVFSSKPEGWGDFRKGRRDHEAITHAIALQFVAEAIQNSRHMGSRPQEGKKSDFYTWINDEKRPKIEIVVEKLVKRIYGDDGQPLPRSVMTSEDNAAGVRILFFSYDPEYKFSDVLMNQISKNRVIRSKYLEDSDDDQSEDEDRRGAGRGAGGGGGGARNGRRRAAGDKVDLDDDDLNVDGDDDGGGQRKRSRKKRMTRTLKHREALQSNTTETDIFRAKLSASEYPNKQFLHVTDAHVLGSVLFDPQLNTMHYTQSSDLKALDYDLGSNTSDMRMELLNFDDVIRMGARLGCDPVQADPANYWAYEDNGLVAAEEDDDDDDDDDDDEDDDGDGDDEIDRLGGAGGASRVSRRARQAHDSDLDDDDDDDDDDADDDAASAARKRHRLAARDSDFEEDSDEDSLDAAERRNALRNKAIQSKRLAALNEAEKQAASVANEQEGMVDVLPDLPPMPKLSTTDENAVSAAARVHRFGSVQRTTKIFSFDRVKTLCWSIHPRDFSASKLMETYFPWYPHTQEYLEEKLLSAVLRCHQMRIFDSSKVAALERDIVAMHASENYTGDVTRKKALHVHGIHTPGEDDRAKQIQTNAVDPTEPLSDTFMGLENAIYHIFHADREMYCKYMRRMRSLAYKFMHKVLDSSDQRLPDSVLTVLDYVREYDLKHLCLDTNVITMDLSPCLNQMVHFLLQLETLQISTTHFYIYEVVLAIFSAYLSKKRTKLDLKNNIMIHGPPGTGKSKVISTAADHLIDDSTDSVTARSMLSMINPKSRNFTAELYDEGASLYDSHDKALSAKEKQAKRIEQSAMSRQQIDYQYTMFHPETKQRMVMRIKMPYNHVKVASTNVPPKAKGDAMADRWKHITIMSQRRPGRDLVDYQTAMDTRENRVHEQNIKRQREHTQILMLYSAIANKFCALPTPNMDVLRIRLSQTLAFLKKTAPNAKFRVRDAIRMITEGMTATFMYANLLVFGSELSPYRRIEINEQYVEHRREEGNYDPDDYRNYRIVYQDYTHEHLDAVGPHLVCTDDIAIRILTGVVMNLLNPMHHAVLCEVAREYGNFHVEEVLDYYDDKSDSGYHARKKLYEEFEREIENRGGLWHGSLRTQSLLNSGTSTSRLVTDDGNFASSSSGANRQRPTRSSATSFLSVPSQAVVDEEQHDDNDDGSSSSSPQLKSLQTPILPPPPPRQSADDSDQEDGDDGDGDDSANVRSGGKKGGKRSSAEQAEKAKSSNHIYGYPELNTTSISRRGGRGAASAQSNSQRVMKMLSSMKGAVSGESAAGGDHYTRNVYISGTRMDREEHQTRSALLPTFIRMDIDNLNSASYSPTYLRINMTEDVLMQRCHDLCRKKGWDYDDVKSILQMYFGRNVQLRHVPNIHHGLETDRYYLLHKIASKMEDGPSVVKQSGPAIGSRPTEMYMAVDLLLASPMRVVRKLVESFEYEHTERRTVLLGVPDTKNPFCPVSAEMRPRPGVKIVFPNVKYNNAKIYQAIDNGHRVGDDNGTMEEPFLHSREIAVEGDLEAYAIDRHFAAEGYDLRYKHLYLPSTNFNMMRAIYASMDPERENFGLYDKEDVKRLLVKDPEGVERGRYDARRIDRLLDMAAMKYTLGHNIDPASKDAEPLMENFHLMCKVLVRARSHNTSIDRKTGKPGAPNTMLNYPKDFEIPGYDRKLKTALDRQKSSSEEKKKKESPSKADDGDDDDDDENEDEVMRAPVTADTKSTVEKQKRQKRVHFADDEEAFSRTEESGAKRSRKV